MPIQVKITLDSGTLLEDDENDTTFAYVEIGTFKPKLNIYADGELAGVVGEEGLLNRQIEMRRVAFAERREAAAVTLASELLERHLMRLPELYGESSRADYSDYVPINIDAFDCTFRFTAGHVRSSMVKDRDFVEVDHETLEPTGSRRTIPQIAHNLVVEFELAGGEAFELRDGGRVLWSSRDRRVERSLEVEVLADNSTAESFYRTALKLPEGQNYWLPNLGDPPPSSPYRGQSQRLKKSPPGEAKSVDQTERERRLEPDLSKQPQPQPAPPMPPELYFEQDSYPAGAEEDGAVGRYINLWFTTQRADEPRIPPSVPLVWSREVYLRLNIAQYDSRTILKEARPFLTQDEIEEAFPETRGKPVTLEISLFSSDFEISAAERTQKLKLARDKPTETLYFKVIPFRSRIAFLRVCVFYKNHLLQSLGVTVLASAEEETGRPWTIHVANVETTYSADFAGVGELPARGLWLGINESADGTHALNVKTESNALDRNLEDKIESALEQARAALNKVSFDIEKDDEGRPVIDEQTGLPKKIYRFDNQNFPKASGEEWRIKRFREDLTALAEVGSSLFDAVFGSGFVPPAERRDLLSVADNLKKTLRNPQVIQVTRLKRLEDIWPWALMYDLPIDPGGVKEVCLAYRGADGRALPSSEGIKLCKHRDARGFSKDRSVVCPYGFWGFKHIIEQPTWPGGEKAFANLILKLTIPEHPVLAMPLASALQQTESAHVQGMKTINFKFLDSFEEVEKALSPDYEPPPSNPHVLYFFCHGKYDQNKNPYLQIGANDALRPADLEQWAFRWEDSHGLVFINGCHTVDLSPKDLSVIMAPFVKAYASGIIGTEITVHTFLAREFAQGFFKLLLPNGNPGQKVGTIIRDLRLELLMKYNPLGLVYTPYCSAELQFFR
jgi:hypothetical protein